MYTADDYKVAEEEIKAMGSLRPVTGTFTIHSVRGNPDGGLYVNKNSCYKAQCCLNAIGPHCHWTTAQVSPLQILHPIPDAEREGIQNIEREETPKRDREELPNMERENIANIENEEFSHSIHTGDWVKAMYDSVWYLGTVLEIAEDECLISFMTTHERGTKRTFQWPSSADTVWIPLDPATIQAISAPEPIGRSKRFFTHANF